MSDLCKCTLPPKLVSRISFNPVVSLMLMNYCFDCYDLKICYMKILRRSHGQDHSLALET